MSDVASDMQSPPVGSGHQVHRLDRVSDVVNPVQAPGDVVDRQTERLVEVFADEDATVRSVKTGTLDLNDGTEIRPVQRTVTDSRPELVLSLLSLR